VESAIINSLKFFGYDAYVGAEPGIWIRGENRKVASLGMAIDGNISYHGFALNLTQEPIDGFLSVNPCGMEPSMMGFVPLDRSSVIREIVNNFSSEYGQFNEVSRHKLMEVVRTLS
jgi:lipoyl(octanoyl) transferase